MGLLLRSFRIWNQHYNGKVELQLQKRLCYVVSVGTRFIFVFTKFFLLISNIEFYFRKSHYRRSLWKLILEKHILENYISYKNISCLHVFFFIRTLRFELHCSFSILNVFEHQNVPNFSKIQASVFLKLLSHNRNKARSRTTVNTFIRQQIHSQYTIGFMKKDWWILIIENLIKLEFLLFSTYTVAFLFWV